MNDSPVAAPGFGRRPGIVSSVTFGRRAARVASAAAWCLAGIALLAGPPATAQFPSVELGSLDRPGGQIGSDFEIKVASGKNTGGAEHLWFSEPSIRAERIRAERVAADSDDTPPAFRVTLPADLVAGRYEVRLIGSLGVSNPRIFLATEEPWAVDPAGEREAGEPEPIAPHSVISRQARPATVDRFSIDLDAGDVIRIRLRCRQVGSPMIGHLSLAAPDGRRRLSARGGEGLDPSLVFVAESGGRHRIEVHDVLFRGGPEYGYLIDVSRGPSDTDLPQADPIAADPIHEDAIDEDPTAGSAVAATAPRLPTPALPEAAGVPGWPADVPRVSREDLEPTPVTPPLSVVGQFLSDGGADPIEMALPQGQTWQIEVVSQRLGEPSDPFWWLERHVDGAEGSRWERIQMADDSQAVGDGAVRLHSADAVGIVNSAAGGRHRLWLRDLDTGQTLREHKAYRLLVGPPRPDFRLVAYRPYPHADINQTRPHGSVLLPGGGEAIRVFALRSGGWTGEIEVAVEGLPEGVRCEPAWIGANQTTTQLTVSADESFPPGDLPLVFEPRVVGRAVVGDDTVGRVARSVAVDWGRGDGREMIRSRLSTGLVMAVADAPPSPLSVAIGDDAPTEIAKGSAAKIALRLTRGDGAQAACVVRPRDLPPGVTAAEVNVPADQATAESEWKVAGDAVPGRYTVGFQVETKVKWRDQDLTIYLPSPHQTIHIVEAP